MKKKLIDLYGYIVLITACLVVTAALWVEHKMGIRPCLLCMYQRYGWVVLGTLSLFALAPFKTPKRWIPMALGFFCLGLAGLATYQILIEEKYIEAPQACRTVAYKAQSAEELWKSLEEKPLAPCDQAPFKWGGLSMASYSGLLSTLLACLCFLAWFYQPWGSRKFS